MVLSLFSSVAGFAPAPLDANFNVTRFVEQYDVAGMVRDADVDVNGKLSFDEFKKAIVMARKQYEPEVIEDHECLCKVQSAFDFVDLASDEEVDAAELTTMLEAAAKLAHSFATAEPSTHNASARRQLQMPYEYQWSPIISQWMKGVYTLKPDPYSYIPKAENKISPPPPPGPSSYSNWPLLKPRWEGQTRMERWWEVWGLANGGRRVDTNGNRIRPGNRDAVESLGRGKVRGCTPPVASTYSAPSDSSVCFNLKGDAWCTPKATECSTELYVYTNCMATCSPDC